MGTKNNAENSPTTQSKHQSHGVPQPRSGQRDLLGGRVFDHQMMHKMRNELQAVRLGIMLLDREPMSDYERSETFTDLYDSLNRLMELADLTPHTPNSSQ